MQNGQQVHIRPACAAIGLYEAFGFVVEGRKLRGRKLEDRYQDLVLMALWL